MLWADMWDTATGDNLIQKYGFYRNQPEYLFYLMLPAGHWILSDGDQPRDKLGGLGPSYAPNVLAFQYYSLRNNNPYARWMSHYMMSSKARGAMLPWQAILYAEVGGQQKPLSELPLVKYFAPSGVAMLRSGWDLSEKSTDTVAAFYCRPFEAHAHFDAGHFALWRGRDKLVDSAGYYWSTEIPYHHCFYTRTVAHNCVLIHQPGEKFQHGPFICNDGGQVQGDPALASLRHWRIEIEPTEASADTVFPNVLDIGPADDPAPVAATLVRRDAGIGASLKRGASTSEVLFYADLRQGLGHAADRHA